MLKKMRQRKDGEDVAKEINGICKGRWMRNKKRLSQNAGNIATIAAEALAVTGVVASVLLCSVPGVGTEPGRSAELDEVYVPLSTGSEKAADIPDIGNAEIMALPVIRCTCYCTGTITATGKRVREGMISSSREHFGQSANLYTESGELIGTFVCEDTGGKPIKQGKVLDVYRNDIDGVHWWQKEYGDYVRIEWIEREEDGNKKESK
jgi:hypothetical protein